MCNGIEDVLLVGLAINKAKYLTDTTAGILNQVCD